MSTPKFRLETNSKVVWLYAGGVSLILTDVRFGMVSLDWITNVVGAVKIIVHKANHTE